MKKLSLLKLFTAFCLLSQAQSYVPVENNARIKVVPAIDLQAYAFNLRDVKLLEGSPFKHAMEGDSTFYPTLLSSMFQCFNPKKYAFDFTF